MQACSRNVRKQQRGASWNGQGLKPREPGSKWLIPSSLLSMVTQIVANALRRQATSTDASACQPLSAACLIDSATVCNLELVAVGYLGQVKQRCLSIRDSVLAQSSFGKCIERRCSPVSGGNSPRVVHHFGEGSPGLCN